MTKLNIAIMCTAVQVLFLFINYATGLDEYLYIIGMYLYRAGLTAWERAQSADDCDAAMEIIYYYILCIYCMYSISIMNVYVCVYSE